MDTVFHRLIRKARHKQSFLATCRANGLMLDYGENASGIGIFKEIFVQRAYADFFPFHEAATVIDIGGHFGYFALFAAVNLADKGQVITVEPSRHNFEKLERNLNQSGFGKKVLALNRAVAPIAGSLKLYTGKSENNTLVAPSEGGSWEMTEAITLDELIGDLSMVHFLKMDCEGAEYEVLYGADRGVLDRIQTISMEFHDLKSAQKNGLKLAQFLKSSGFNVVRFHHNTTSMGNNYGHIVATKAL